MARLNAVQREAARRRKRHLARIDADFGRKSSIGWLDRFRALEAELLKQRPHLSKHEFCQVVECEILAPPVAKPKVRRVALPNGHVLYSAWYTVPTGTVRDGARALEENRWLRRQAGYTTYI